jgi:hypothetical protein
MHKETVVSESAIGKTAEEVVSTVQSELNNRKVEEAVADAILVISGRAINDWTLNATLTEPFYGALKRKVKSHSRGVIVRTENGPITDWADYYVGLSSRRTALAPHFE